MEPRDGWRSVLRAFENQRAFSKGYSPLYEALMDEMARAAMPLAADEAPWPESEPFVEVLGRAWSDRSFATPIEPSLLVAAAMHRAVLAGAPEAEPLRPFYPTVGGAFDPGDREALREAFLSFWRNPPEDAVAFLREGRVQTNELSRAPAWLFTAAALGSWFRLPVDVVDLGSSGGLTLTADRLTWEWRGPHGVLRAGDGSLFLEQTLEVDGDPRLLGFPVQGTLPLPRVRRREGIDLHPVDLRDPGARLGLRACVWPDQTDRLARLDAAIDAFLSTPEEDAPRLRQGDMVEGVLSLVPDPPAPRILLFYNTVAAMYLPPEAYARLEANVARRFGNLPPGHVGVWVELETPREAETEAARDKRYVRLTAKTCGPHGRLEKLTLGHAEPHPRSWCLEPDGWAALRETLSVRARV